jgi:alkanesulfonate monooxygenase SsuD/methylene tetrahydromethanopterin reductase-like flavin-dependent oxidoreductase (luciferase family)
MNFGLYLPGYWPDVSVHMRHLYDWAVAEASAAEGLGFNSFTIPEHHFSNALVHPNPLLTAIKIADHTKDAPIITSTSVLPFHDVRRLAGEVAQADCLTNGRIGVGVGRGAYRYEFERFEKNSEEAPDLFRESLQLLVKLLSEEEVSADGDFYKFPSTTITPRPVQQPHPPIWFAAMTPGGIDYAVSLDMPVLTTPLRDPFETVKVQAGAFQESKQRHDKPELTMSMLVMIFVTRDDRQRDAIVDHALGRHRRFLNMFTTSGTVERGSIKPIESDLTREEIAQNLIIGPADYCIERLKLFEREGIDNLQLNFSFGASHEEIMTSMHDFAALVMPSFID